MSDEQTSRTMIAGAEALIGEEDEQDYKLQPTEFAGKFASASTGLATLLNESTLTQTARRYRDKDAEAVEEQAVFRRLSTRTTAAVFIASIAAALLSAWAASPFSPKANAADPTVLLQDPVALVLGLLATLAGAWAAMLLSRLKGGRYLARWMSARAGAETERLGYFNKLAGMLARQKNAAPGDMLIALELFRRYQLGLQQVYYRQRGRQHRLSMEKTLRLASIASFVLAGISGLTGIIGAFEPALLWIAALGIFGAALTNVASRREEINQDERNSERYARTADILDHLREKHSAVQRALAAGKAEVLVNYVHAVHEQLSLEHRQWLSQADAIASAVEQLEQSLTEIGAENKAE